MPREASITYEQVAAAAAFLEAKGTKPNQRNVRERLGTGSMGTINRFLRQYMGSKPAAATAPITLPPALQQVITEYLAQQIGCATEDLEVKFAAAQSEASDLADDNERHSRLVESLEGEISTLGEERASLTGRVSQLETDLAESRKEATEARQAAEESRTKRATAELRLEALPRLELEVTRLQGSLDAERALLADAEKRAATAEASSSGLADRLADANEQHKQMLAALESQLAQGKQSSAETTNRLEAEKQRLETELSTVRKDWHGAAEKIGRLEGQIEGLKQQSGK